ncbi:TetR/AcrR family transcriptional regulator [Amphibacillus indicireducens]|uniref:TetR family transcriptional regulator n=1 Tax=Amphibacillus indicireducens TaxID=1076330 RepID=A0ABP7VK92_9BACI
MPKQTFFNLDDQKKETLIAALKEEFSRASVHDASVANIVKLAQIPRGSFYQYFYDKEDAFLFLLSLYGDENKRYFTDQLELSNGDLFASFLFMFKRMISELVNGNQYHFFRNAFLNMNHKMEQAFTRNLKDDDFGTEVKNIAKWIKKGPLAVESEKELEHVFKILTAVTFQNIIHAFAQQLTVEEACHNYQVELNMLKHGLLKKTD